MKYPLLASLTLLSVAACTHRPKEQSHEATATAAWEAVLDEGTQVEVFPLVTGEIEVERSFLLDYKNPNLQDLREEKQYVPVVAYLVRHPTAGDFLLDTGFDHTFAESGHGNFGGFGFLASFARQTKGNDTLALIKSLGVDPETLRMIVLSHMHSDHTAGLPDLPKTVPLVTGKGAIASYETLWYAPADHLAGFEALYTLDFPEQGAIDVVGDGSLLVLATPGHAAGNASFLLRAKNGPVLLTCDASHTQEGFGLGVSPGGVEDRGAADASLETLRSFVAAHPEVRVKAGHDASDWDLSRGVQESL